MASTAADADAWEALVRAVAAAPQDDGPRRVAADWLLARGDVRGEYAAASLSPEGASRAAELLRLHGDDWLKPLLELGAQPFHAQRDGVPSFTRGFVETAGLFGRSVANLAELQRLEPVTGVRLTSGGPGPLAQAAKAPGLERVRALKLDGRYTEGTEAVLGARLPALQWLVVNELGDRHAVALAGSGARPLTVVADVAKLGAGVRNLAEASFFSRVVALKLERATAAVVADIARTLPAQLQSLTFHETELRAEAVETLGARLDSLTELAITGFPTAQGRVELGRAAVRALVRHLKGGRLQVLDLHGIACDSLGELLSSPALSSVERLILADGTLTVPIAEALVGSPYRGRLKELNAEQTFDDAALERLDLPGVNVMKRRTEPWD